VAEGVRLEEQSERLRREAAEALGGDNLELDRQIQEYMRLLQERVRDQEELFALEEQRLENARLNIIRDLQAGAAGQKGRAGKLVQQQEKVRSERLKLVSSKRELKESEELLQQDVQRLLRRDRAFRIGGVVEALEALKDAFSAKA